MTELAPLTSQPFPDSKPFFDVRDYLTNGWVSAGTQTFAVRPDGNVFDFIIRVRGDSATGIYIAENIPIRPAYVVNFQAKYGSENVWLAMNGNGGLAITGAGSAPFAGEVSAIIRMPMRR